MKKNQTTTGVFGTAIKADDEPECKASDEACNGDQLAQNTANQPQSQQAPSNEFREPSPSEPSPEAAHKWWYELVESTENIDRLAQGFREGTAIWVTDGSYKAPYGSAAFILKPSLDLEILIKLVNQTPGRAKNMDAYQVEVAGIYGCVTFTNNFLRTHHITTAAATMTCDCLSA
jgi:hypothetical protein